MPRAQAATEADPSEVAAVTAPAPARRSRAAPAAEATEAVHVDPTATAAAPKRRAQQASEAVVAEATPSTTESSTPAPAARAARVAKTTGTVSTDGAKTTSGDAPSAAYVAVDYDSMTYDDFLVHLKQRTKRETVNVLMERAKQEADEKKSSKDLEGFTDGTGGYSYVALLDRVYEILRAKNPKLTSTEASRNQIPVPQIERYGSKKTAVPNFAAICKAINRSMEEVKDYLDKELSTTGSIDSSNCLILKLQNVKSIQFEGIIIKYVEEFVKCHSCKKINSTLQKEDRITVLKCNLCLATRTVTAGGSAFHAVTGKRSKMRANAQM